MESMNHYVCECLCTRSYFLSAVMGVMAHIKHCGRRNEANSTLDIVAKNVQALSLEGFINLCVYTKIKPTSITCLYGVLFYQKMPEHLQYVSEAQLEGRNTIPQQAMTSSNV